MISENNQVKAITFFQALDFVSVNNNFDIGLVVSGSVKASDLTGLIPPKASFELISVNSTEHPDDILKKIIHALEDKKWVILDLEEAYMPSRLYNQLQLLSTDNRLEITNLIGSEEKEVVLSQPMESRVCVVTNEKISEELGVPFMSLFGSVLNI